MISESYEWYHRSHYDSDIIGTKLQMQKCISIHWLRLAAAVESEPESEPDGAAGAAGLGVTVTAAGPPARLRRVDIVTDSQAAGRARGAGPDSQAGRQHAAGGEAARPADAAVSAGGCGGGRQLTGGVAGPSRTWTGHSVALSGDRQPELCITVVSGPDLIAPFATCDSDACH